MLKRPRSSPFELPQQKKFKSTIESPGEAPALLSKSLEMSKPVGKSKMVIKPFKVKPTLPVDFEITTWTKLKESIHAVFDAASVGYSREELYRSVEDMCIYKLASNLYYKLKDVCEERIGIQVEKLVGRTPDPVAFLSLVFDCWTELCSQILVLRSIFLYLDQSFVLHVPTLLPVQELCYDVFRKHLAMREQVSAKVVTGLLSLVERERRGEGVNRPLIKNLLHMTHVLGVYEELFQKPFLAATAVFYDVESKHMMTASDTATFLLHVERRLNEERERVANYLEPVTRRPLMSIVEQQFLPANVASLISRGFDELVDGNRFADLQRMHRLVNLPEVSAGNVLLVAWSAYIKRCGLEIVMDPEKDEGMVENLLLFKAKLDALCENALNRDPALLSAVKDGFQYFINCRENKPAELIARFCDAKLRSSRSVGSESELEALLDKVMVLFRFIAGKDVFETFYKRDLAKRLVYGKCNSYETEKCMIAKLKAECGSAFTGKLDGMFRDMDVSKDLLSAFKGSETARNPCFEAVDLSVMVLTTGFWPVYPPCPVVLPSSLIACQSAFEKFYYAKYNGRKLAWQHNLGQCVLKGYFPKATKEVSVSLFQALVLLLFNLSATLSLADIRNRTGLEEKELRRVMQSLTAGKVRVLVKDPAAAKELDSDRFTFNEAFASKLYRIKISSIHIKDTAEENTATNKRILHDRQYQIEAAIVRIMKTRKTLTHQLLVAEVFSLLKFSIPLQDLKKRVESLIERDYLERDEHNPQVYNYVA